MGAWSTKIHGNDTFQDIYQNFFDQYNQGQNPTDVSKQIQDDFADMFNDYEDRNNSLFGLALAQWETKSLDQEVYQEVKRIIEAETDLEVWQRFGADSETIEERKKELAKFLTQISTEREKPKRRVRQKFVYSHNQLLKITAPCGKKTFEIIENYTNGKYEDTTSTIDWSGSGSNVFYCFTKGKFITAHWVDSQTLEIRHDKTITFRKKLEDFYRPGDEGVIKYIAE